MDQDSAHMVAASKVPMLKPSGFEIWRMRIEQYIQMIDNAPWDVGNGYQRKGQNRNQNQTKSGNLDVAKIVIPEDEEIDDNNLHEKLLKIIPLHLLTKSSSTSPISFLEKTNTFDDSLPELENFCFDLEEISSGNTTIHSNISLPDYEAFSFYNDHIFPPTDRSDFTHEEFADELAHIISPPEYDCFLFKDSPDDEDSRARGFVQCSLGLHPLACYFGNHISLILLTNV
nr:hypothetical protein [Tanacetum cinerariifolium]